MKWKINDNHQTLWFVEFPCVCKYKYSKYNISPQPYFPELKALANFVEKVTGSEGSNSVNMNLYPDQHSKVGMHSDSEDLFQADFSATNIISISLGATRRFILQAKEGKAVHEVSLQHGDILTMEGLCQKFYKHALLPSPLPCGHRINLTFRKIVQHKQYCSLAKE